MSIADQLKEMGFAQEKIDKAIKEAGGSLDQAMEWILNHQDDSVPSTSSTQVAKTPEQPADEQVPENEKTVDGQIAKSMKCEDCQRLFPNEDSLVWHASKTGHSNFSESTEEIKPRTPEEIKAQLAALELRIKENRKKKLEQERQEELEKERSRRTQGREIVELRQKYKEDEMKREAEARRKEKQEDAMVRKRILEQIERDRADRKQREAGNSAAPPPQAKPTVVTPGPPKNYNESKLQIRLTNGQTLTATFKVEEVLAVVRCYVMTNRTDGDVPFQLMTTFPRKVFTEDDMGKTLKDLNLVPSAVLTLGKIKEPTYA